jgi:hypothetical protein
MMAVDKQLCTEQRTRLRDGVWKLNRHEAEAPTESIVVYECDRVGNHNHSQADKTMERISTDACNRIADYDC